MKRETFFLLSACLLFAQTAFAQNEFPCATDFLHQQALQDPVFFQKHQALEQEALEYFSLPPAPSRGGGEAATVPVVVHIIHNNGPENLSDAQVQQAITWLNQAFANQGYYAQGSGADVGIQFCFAKRTPNGENTNGITRNQSPLTELDIETEQLSMKNLNRWKPKEYINIWVVKSICSTVTGCGVSAYAYYPAYHGGNLDGIVIEYGHLTSPAQVAILAHEMGHYFGLRHTFEGGCSNENCLTDGDRVCDTPPDQSTSGIPCGQTANTCSTDTQSGFSTDQPDMTTNFVDYGNLDCLHDFTDGQGARMNFFLSGTRKSLLASKGCLPPCLLQPAAAFSPGDTTILAGQTLFFDNASQNAVTFSWTINGAPFGGQQNAAYFFDTAGVFTIKLVAHPLDALLCDADSAQVTVQVLCEVTADFSVSDIDPDENEQVFITNNSQNATQQEWFVNGISQGGVLDSIAFSPEGVYILKLWVSNTYCHDEAQVVLTVRDSCKSPGFQMGIQKGAAEIWGYWKHGGIAYLNDGSIVCQSRFVYPINATPQTQALFLRMTSNGSVIWSKTVGDSTSSSATVYSLKPSPDGGFAAAVLINYYNPNYPYQVGVMKFSQDGDLLWYRYFTSMPSEYLFQDLVCNPDGSIVACGYATNTVESHILVVKFDPNGNPVWEKRYRADTGGRHYGKSIARTPDNGYVIAGQVGNISPNVGSLIMKLDSSGAIVWNKIQISSQEKGLNEVQVLANGTILLAGYEHAASSGSPYKGWLSKMSPSGQLLWSKSVAIPGQSNLVLFDLEEGPVGFFTAVGRATPSNKSRGVILRFDSTGQCLWAQEYSYGNNPSSTSYFQYITAAPGSIFYIQGHNYPSNASHIWLLKTDPAGFTGDCLPETFPVQTSDVSISDSSEIFSLQPLAPIESATPPIQNITLGIDTLCAPECYVSSEICNNNLDDDSDGLFDCLDPDCNCPEDVCAPKEADIWYFGNQAGLDFSTEPPTVLTDGQTSGYATTSSVACDAAGNLLFYADLQKAYNRFHEVMQNGSGLNGTAAASTPEVIIVPHPGNPSQFYVFSVGEGISQISAGLRYSKVDMQLDSGKGGVVPNEKAIQLGSKAGLHVAAVRSCAFDGYWVIAVNDGNFHAYRIDQNGLNLTPIKSSGGGGSDRGQMKISPDGRRIAREDDFFAYVYFYNFNANTGSIASLFSIWISDITNSLAGLEFSPNGRYLYVSTFSDPSHLAHLFQFDLEAGDANAIKNSRISLAARAYPSSFGKMQLAPNGKIYIANYGAVNPFLDVIHNPNLGGAACQYQENGQPLSPSAYQNNGLCNFISSYFAENEIVMHHNAPDTICILDSLYGFTIEGPVCFQIDSFSWKLEGLSGTLTTDFSYNWVKFDAPGAGNLIVTAYTPCGVVADTHHIFVAEPFDKILDLGPDRVVCDNGVVTLNAGSGFAHYRWQNGSPDSLLTTLLPGKYWVDVWDACGNQQTDTVNVSVAPATVLELGEDQEGCPDLTATFQRPGIFEHWLWSPADFLSCDTCASVVVSPAATTEWIVVAQTGDGCISVDTLTFQIQDTLFFQLDTSVCIGQMIDLFGTTFPADTTAQIFFPATGLGCDTLLTVNVLGLDVPMSEVEATICFGQFFNFNGVALPADTTAVFLSPGVGAECDSVTIVTVSAFPPLTVALPPDTTLRIGATLILKVETSGTGALTFAWSPADGLSCTTCSDAEASPLATTLYTLQVADANGCSAQDSMLVVVDTACNVIIPNAFSPNGDGVNDWFYPRTDPCVRMVRLWRVVSRWGEIVFEKSNFSPNDPTFGWDGNRSNGEPFPSDVLVWYAELEYFDGKKELKKGDVALLR